MKNCMYDCSAPCFFPFPEVCHRSHFSACKAATEQLSPAGAVQIRQCLLQRCFHSCPGRQLTADSIWSLQMDFLSRNDFLIQISHTKKSIFVIATRGIWAVFSSHVLLHCCTLHLRGRPEQLVSVLLNFFFLVGHLSWVW